MSLANRFQVKICGLTDPEKARQAVALGADAIGLVFHPPSPRHLTPEKAREIVQAVFTKAATVAVFVDEAVDQILELRRACGFSAVQLHGRETPLDVIRLKNEGLCVIKALFMDREPQASAAQKYAAADAFLIECGKGPLPGGNAASWDWGAARGLDLARPCILAGGLSPENAGKALDAARPDAVDVSSGVESAPGEKDLAKVAAFIRAVAAHAPQNEIRRIF